MQKWSSKISYDGDFTRTRLAPPRRLLLGHDIAIARQLVLVRPIPTTVIS